MRFAAVTLAGALLTIALAPAALAAAPDGQASTTATKAAAPVMVNLNTATSEQLQKLSGIGPRTAARILEYRQKNGGFKKIEELMNVRGIGEKSFLRIKPQLTVTPAKPDRP